MKFGIDTPATLPQSSFTNMGVKLALGLRAFCVAVSLLLISLRGAEPVSPLIGATRDQVLARYGEPKSQIAAGSRVIFFYAREKIVLRDNVVVEVESLSAEPIRGAAETPTVPAQNVAPSTSTEPAPSARPAAPVTPAPPAGDSKVEIKMVRPPTSKDGRSTATEPIAPAPIATTPATVTPKASPRVPPPDANTAPVIPANVATPATSTPADESGAAPSSSETRKTDDAAKKKKAALPKPAPKVETSPPIEEPDSAFGSRLFLIAGAVVLGGIILLYWRYRQRQFVLAATSVVNTPLTPTNPPAFTGNGFTAEELSKLEWKRFEELVTAYYSKTGVVAVRTKTGPDSPVHIKISWKGEPRPFAYVQCLARPSGLIDLKPLQSLVAALEADNIRRGYVVTSGKFNVQARDFAEEKHLTLLSSEVFLEKLNALPSAARTEIVQSIGAKDSSAA
jgi:hypothetical protein